MPSIILYSFRRCPYAIRARLALAVSGIEYEHREVLLKNKPQTMLALSPKGTVPVLVLGDGKVIDESLDIMLWALSQHDPQQWLLKTESAGLKIAMELIKESDSDFKYWLDRYKYFDRFPEHSQKYYRQNCEVFIAKLESRLISQAFLNGNSLTLMDMAIASFIRQFAYVDQEWFFNAQYSRVQTWLNNFLESALFLSVMQKYTPYAEDV